jgi:F-type H+-transporting ATPase subunit a
MTARTILALALAGTFQAAALGAQAHDVPAPVQPDAHASETMQPQTVPALEGHGADDAHAADDGHGDGVDFMHHILDAREWELPGKVVHLPAAGSWMVGGIDLTPTKHVIFLAIAAALTLLTLLYGGLAAARAGAGRTAGKRHNAIEATVLFLRDTVVMANIGKGGEKFAPFIVTLFFFILFNNLLGLVPFGATATANISVTAALALLTFVVTEVAGMMKLGAAGYMGTILMRPAGMHPVAAWVMAIALMPVEILGKFTKPIALAIRLMANMTAGHIVLLAIISLIFVFGTYTVLPGVLFLSVAIFFLEIFVAFLQAYVFVVLTSVFIGLIRHAH